MYNFLSLNLQHQWQRIVKTEEKKEKNKFTIKPVRIQNQIGD